MIYEKILKRETIIISVSVIAMVLILVGSSYALFMQVNNSSNMQVVNSGTLSVAYQAGTTMTTALVPQSDATGLASSGYSFSVTNNGTLNCLYDIEIYNDPDNNSNAIPQQYLIVSLDGGTPVTLTSLSKSAATSGEIIENNIKYVIKSDGYLAASGQTGDVATHNIKVWIDEDAPTSIIGKTVALEVIVNGEAGDNLANNILNDNGGSTAIVAKTTPNFTTLATTNEGMFAATDNYGTSYYYRGAVTNNNVIFGGFCWKVIRVNGNGTVRMIYNGTPTNGTCVATGASTKIGNNVFNTLDTDNAYVGYMYGTAGGSTYADTHANTNSSAIKNIVDTWYNNNLSSYANKLADTTFCGDRSLKSGTGIGTTSTYYKYLDRALSKAPSLLCANKNDYYTVDDTTNGNGALTKPIGLISTDEIVYAGASINSEDVNATFYLNSNVAIATMTPNSYGTTASNYYMEVGGYIVSDSVAMSIDVRPVINLKANQFAKSGNGTSTTPYVIS